MSPELESLFEIVRGLETRRKSRIWCLVHSGRAAHICFSTQMAVWKDRCDVGRGEKLELLLHSPGGHPQIAYSAMRFFRSRFKEVNVIVPLMAKSAATLMCLGADSVFMGEMAELGPMDIQIDDQVQHGAESFSPLNEFKSLEFIRDQAMEWVEYYAILMNRRYGLSLKEAVKDSVPLVTGLMRPILEKVDPIKMGGHRRDLAIAEEYAKRMLALTSNNNESRIVRQIVWEYPSHDFCIDRTEAADIGLPIKPLEEEDDTALTEALFNLNDEDSHEGFRPKPATSSKSVVTDRPKVVRRDRKKSANGSETYRA